MVYRYSSRTSKVAAEYEDFPSKISFIRCLRHDRGIVLFVGSRGAESFHGTRGSEKFSGRRMGLRGIEKGARMEHETRRRMPSHYQRIYLFTICRYS